MPQQGCNETNQKYMPIKSPISSESQSGGMVSRSESGDGRERGRLGLPQGIEKEELNP